MVSSEDVDVCPITDPKLDTAKVGQIRAAAQKFATDEEIAAHIGIDVEALIEYHGKTIETERLRSKLRLRDKLNKLAEDGDAEAIKILGREQFGYDAKARS